MFDDVFHTAELQSGCGHTLDFPQCLSAFPRNRGDRHSLAMVDGDTPTIGSELGRCLRKTFTSALHYKVSLKRHKIRIGTRGTTTGRQGRATGTEGGTPHPKRFTTHSFCSVE